MNEWTENQKMVINENSYNFLKTKKVGLNTFFKPRNLVFYLQHDCLRANSFQKYEGPRKGSDISNQNNAQKYKGYNKGLGLAMSGLEDLEARKKNLCLDFARKCVKNKNWVICSQTRTTAVE